MRARLLIALLVTGLLGCGERGTDGPVVARVADRPITATAFRTQYIDYLLRTGQHDGPRLRRAFLDHLVQVRLVGEEARATGLVSEDDTRLEAARITQKLLLDAYVARVLYDTLQVREGELQDMFVRANTQWKARHLYARTRAGADSLYARLQAGASFEALAREVFADTALANHGGSVGVFGFDEMDPAFEDAVHRLDVGAVSPPVRTAQGYSIIQLEDRFVRPLMTETEYAQRRDKMRRYVLFRKKRAARTVHLQALAAEMAPAFEEPALTRLLAQVTGAAVTTDEDDWTAAPLVTFGLPDDRRTWTVADFRERAALADPALRARVSTRDDLRAFVEGLLAREAMLARARALGLDRLPAFREAFAGAMDEWVYEQARARLRARLAVPDDTLRAYAGEGPVMMPERVRVAEIVVDTRAEADALRARLDSTPFATLARQYSLRPGADATGGDLGYLSARQLGQLAAPVFAADAGAVLGPMAVAGRYVLLQVGDRSVARPARFEEVRQVLEEPLRDRLFSRFLSAYTDTLRTRYDVVVYAAALAAISLSSQTTS